jgi:hypothetical protein
MVRGGLAFPFAAGGRVGGDRAELDVRLPVQGPEVTPHMRGHPAACPRRW